MDSSRCGEKPTNNRGSFSITVQMPDDAISRRMGDSLIMRQSGELVEVESLPQEEKRRYEVHRMLVEVGFNGHDLRHEDKRQT
jgi:hypothetical protein